MLQREHTPRYILRDMTRRWRAMIGWGIVVVGTSACGAQGTSDDTSAVTRRVRYEVLEHEDPEIADWLSLRVAALTPDSAERAARYAAITIPAAKERIPWTEAQARLSAGDTVGAIDAYRRLSVPMTVLRLQGATARTATDSLAVRQGILRSITTAMSASAVRDGAALFDQFIRQPTVDEQLAVARAAAKTEAWGRARVAYAATMGRAVWNPTDVFSYARSLSEGNDDAGAAAQFARVTGPRSFVAAAQYQRARALIAQGKRAPAQTALRTLVKTSPSDTSAAAALSLLADLATDDRDDVGARALLLRLAQRFPSSRWAPNAKFDAAIIALVLGNAKGAAKEFSVLSRSPSDIAARYWLGRALRQTGDQKGATSAWTSILQRDSTSYYAVLAAHQLQRPALADVRSQTPAPHMPAVDSAVRRMARLRARNMDAEIRFEADYLYRVALRNDAVLLSTAAAFAGTDQSGRAITLARRALGEIGGTPLVYRLMYPVAAYDTIAAESRANNIDPTLVAALIRQESNFNPHATSPVGARGLMQLMPSVARTIAVAKGMTPWSADRLYDPGTNVVLGVAHLAPLLRRYPDVTQALAAYNAGESRVARWTKKRGADDPELFTERIPFFETRDYVKSIIRNRDMYRALYQWDRPDEVKAKPTLP